MAEGTGTYPQTEITPALPPHKQPRLDFGSAPYAATETAKSPTLLQWLQSQGAIVDGIRVEDAGPAGCRLVADRDLPAGHTIYKVPHKCVLSVEACSEMPHGLRMQELFRFVVPEEMGQEETEAAAGSSQALETVTRRSALYVALMIAPSHDSEAFGPYLAELRECAAPTPFSWTSTGDIESLDDAWSDVPSGIVEEWRDYWDTLHAEYTLLFPKLSEAFPEVFVPALCGEAAWLRAHSLYTSRTFPYYPEVAKPDGVMLPLLDRLNHDFMTANVEWCGVGLECDRGARTKRQVAAGEELFYSYGCKGNAELILGYGFAVWGNPHEIARVTVDLEQLLNPESARFGAAVDAFDVIVDTLRPTGFLGAHEDCKATFKLTLEEQGSRAKFGGAWEALCHVCELIADVGKDMSQREVLSKVLTAGCSELMKDADIKTWTASVASRREQDDIKIGASNCATTREGVTTALRDSQAFILLTALRQVGGERLPKRGAGRGRGGRGRGRGRGRRQGQPVSANPEQSGENQQLQRGSCEGTPLYIPYAARIKVRFS